MIQVEGNKLGAAMKMNVDAANIVMDASVDPNTFDMLSLSRICPMEKRLSTTLLFSPIEVGRDLAKVLSGQGGSSIYIVGNNMKLLSDFEITEEEVVEWLAAVITETQKTVKLSKIFSDAEPGVGSAAIKVAERMKIEVDGYKR